MTFSPGFLGLPRPRSQGAGARRQGAGARRPGAVGAVKRWTGTFKPHPVVITSPFLPAECGRRLEEATARGWIAGYLGPVFTGGPRRRLFGRVSPARVRVFRLVWGRGGSLPRFDGRIETAPDGGTVLRGTIAPPPGFLPVLLVILAE